MKLKRIKSFAAAGCCLFAAAVVPVSAMPADVGGIQNGLPENSEYSYDGPQFEALNETMYATGAANVRTEPNGTIIGQLTRDQKYSITGRIGDWLKVEGAGVDGYAYSDYLTWTPPEQEEESQEQAPAVQMVDMDIMMQAIADVNMREEPNGRIVGVLSNGTDIHVTGNRMDVCWYRCETNDGTVYIYDDYLRPDFPQTMVATHVVNVRTGPSLNDDVQGVLNVGDKVKVSQETNGWYKFTYEKTKKVGYSYADYLSVAK